MRKIAIPILALLLATSMVAVRASHTFADPRDFQVTNNSSTSITQLFVDVTGPEDFEPSSELLQGNTIAPGGGGTVQFDPNTNPGQCVYDFKAVFSDGTSAEADGINLCTTTQINIS